MKKICFNIESEYKGFFIGLINKFDQNKYEIKIISTKNEIINIFSKKNKNKPILIKKRITNNFNKKKIIEMCKILEDKYEFHFSDLMTRYRDLGQYYLFNADKLPKINRANESYFLKINYLYNHFIQLEKELKNCNYFIKYKPDYLSYIITKKHNIKLISFATIRYDNRYFWNENFYLESNQFKSKITNKLKNIDFIDALDKDKLQYIDYEYAKKLIEVDKINIAQTFSNFLKIILNNIKKLILGNYDFNSYSFFSWPLSEINKYRNFKYLKKISINHIFLKENKYIYFPLHLEPEIALLEQGSYLNNSLEIISWISKSLPVDFSLVVKENPLSLSIRSKQYYKKIKNLNNVHFADLSIDSKYLINNSNIVTNILGTTGYESIANLKPLILFNNYSILNNFPYVFKCNDYISTKKAINHILNNQINDEILLKSKQILIQSQIESSFELNKFETYINLYHCSEDIIEKSYFELIKKFNE